MRSLTGHLYCAVFIWFWGGILILGVLDTPLLWLAGGLVFAAGACFVVAGMGLVITALLRRLKTLRRA